jgi:hypothetical protein
MAGKADLRRLTGTVGLLAVAGGLFVLALFLLAQGLDKSTQWVTLIGGAFAIAAVVQGPVRTMLAWRRHGGVPAQLTVPDAVEELATALATEWTQEARRRVASNPRSLPVRWTVTCQAESAMAGVSWDDVAAGDSAVAPHLLAGEYDTIYEAFTTQLPRRRLIVLGQAGGGKSSLAWRLARDLLARRAPGDRVPVFLPLASWNPEEDLYEWVAGKLTRNHPALAALAAGALGRAPVMLSRALVQNEHLLLILDGFDEIPAPLRKSALHGINLLSDQIPLVLTSRTDEYCQAVFDFGRGMTGAAVVELSPVDAEAIKDYLARTTAVVPAGRWDTVFASLDSASGSPVATALRMPLMIWLARTVYHDAASVPADLADPVLFGEPAAIEHHLLDELVMAAYAHPGPPGGSWNPGQARRWLGFLARWLENHRTTDLAWWQLPAAIAGQVDRLMIGLPVGLAAGAAAGIIMGIVTGMAAGLGCGTALAILATTWAFTPVVGRSVRLPSVPVLGRAVALVTGLGVGLPFALGGHLADGVARGTSGGMLAGLATEFLFHSGRSQPTRVKLHIRRNRLPFLRRIVVGLLVGSIFGTVLGVLLGLVKGSATGLVFALLSLAMGIGLGIEDGLNLWIDAPTDVTRAISPWTVMRDDRRAALARALLVAPLAGLGAGLTTAFADGPAAGAAVACAMTVAFAVTDRMVGLASSSWGHFTLARAWLAIRAELPWRLMPFLADAHDRGVLRRSGAVYQFRHARLQQRLAQTSLAETGTAQGAPTVLADGRTSSPFERTGAQHCHRKRRREHRRHGR